MTIKINSLLKRSNKGQMPFALIAVTLLLMAACFGAITYSIEHKEDTTENITEEIFSVTDGIENTEEYIEAGLGSIINKISTDENAGNLVERINSFDKEAENWFKDNFPLKDKGASVSVEDYDLSLGLQNMKLNSGKGIEDENKAGFLRCTGTVEVKYCTQSTQTYKTLEISADGLSGLPFIINCATDFELSTSGSASVLTELVSYQLASLAQLRIMNGYGSVSETGDFGTDGIITKKDVEEAFRNALSIIESLCFRVNGEGIDGYCLLEHVDAAELIASEDGCVEIDISAIYSQTLISMLDLIAGRWMDLMGGDVVSEFFDTVTDTVRKCLNAICSFFTGGGVDKSSATTYLQELMNKYNISENSFRYLYFDKTSIVFNGGEYSVTSKGKTVTVVIPQMVFEQAGFKKDLFSWSGWNGFVDRYHDQRNDIMEMLKGYLNSIAIGITEDIKPVKIQIDAFDENTFVDELSRGVNDALSGAWGTTVSELSEKVSSSSVSDPLFIAIYDEIKKSRETIFGESQLEKSIENNIRTEIKNYIKSKYGEIPNEEILDLIMQDIIEQNLIGSVVDSYSKKVDERMEVFESVLTKVPKDNSSYLKSLLIAAGKKAMELSGFKNIVANGAKAMCQDMIKSIESNSQSELIKLEGCDSYLLYDQYGNAHREYVGITDDYELEVSIIGARNNTSKNYHNIGFDEISMAAYSATITIGIKTEISYSVASSTSVLKILGSDDAAYSGTIPVNTTIDIPCISGWELAGVKYQNSTNIFNEVWKYFLKFFEPIIEPLTKIYKTIESLFNLCVNSIVEITTFVTDLVSQMYDILMEPIEKMIQFIKNTVNDAMSSLVTAFNIGLNKQTIVFGVLGFTVTVELKLASIFKTTKNIVKVTVEKMFGDTKASAFFQVKEKSKQYFVQFGGGVKNDDYSVNVEIDPLMKFGKQLVTVDGYIRDVDFEVALPYVEEYDEVEFCLSDVPGVSEAISNIPLPIPGAKGSFDLGFQLKYNLPFNTDVVINEFELNPAGNDAGCEWVEIYNGNLTEVDVTGFVLFPESHPENAITLVGTIKPMGKMVVYFDEESLCNSKTKNTNGERIKLYDDGGTVIDQTPWKKDTSNDNRTWQRQNDGSSKWIFKTSTEGSANGSLIDVNQFENSFLLKQLLNAMDSALDRLDGHIKSMDDLNLFLQYTLKYFINNVINKIADVLVSAMVYIKLELTDYSSSLHGGIRVGVEVGSEMVEEGLKWLINQIPFLADYVSSPSCEDPLQLVCENAYVSTTVYGEIGTPSFLKNVGERMTVGIYSSVNVSGLCSLFGLETGKWKAKVGIVAEELPRAMLPSVLKKNNDKLCDLWLIKAEFGAR